MNNLFSLEEQALARKTKKTMLIVYLIVAAIVVSAVVLLTVLPSRKFSRDNQMLLIVINVAITTIFGGASLFFFAIKYRLTRNYVKLFRDFERGLKDTVVGCYVEFDNSLTTKDGLLFYSLVLDCVPLRREDISIRKVLVEKSRPKPIIETNTKIKIVTHANILIAYEVIS